MTKSTKPPSTNGDNGRDATGRFTKGNSGGPGNPFAAHIARLRAALMKAVTPKDLREIIKQLVQLAKKGDVRAIKEIFDRTLGRPIEADVLARLESLEQLIQESPPDKGLHKE